MLKENSEYLNRLRIIDVVFLTSFIAIIYFILSTSLNMLTAYILIIVSTILIASFNVIVVFFLLVAQVKKIRSILLDDCDARLFNQIILDVARNDKWFMRKQLYAIYVTESFIALGEWQQGLLWLNKLKYAKKNMTMKRCRTYLMLNQSLFENSDCSKYVNDFHRFRVRMDANKLKELDVRILINNEMYLDAIQLLKSMDTVETNYLKCFVNYDLALAYEQLKQNDLAIHHYKNVMTFGNTLVVKKYSCERYKKLNMDSNYTTEEICVSFEKKGTEDEKNK